MSTAARGLPRRLPWARPRAPGRPGPGPESGPRSNSEMAASTWNRSRRSGRSSVDGLVQHDQVHPRRLELPHHRHQVVDPSGPGGRAVHAGHDVDLRARTAANIASTADDAYSFAPLWPWSVNSVNDPAAAAEKARARELVVRVCERVDTREYRRYPRGDRAPRSTLRAPLAHTGRFARSRCPQLIHVPSLSPCYAKTMLASMLRCCKQNL